MESVTINVEPPPPIPPKSPLRSKRCSIVSIPCIQISESCLAEDPDSTYARLSLSIDDMLDMIRPSSERLESFDEDLHRPATSHRSSFSGSSTYSRQLTAFPTPPSLVRPNTSHDISQPIDPSSRQPPIARPAEVDSPNSSISSASTMSPTSSRPSYSSSRPLSLASTHTNYSTDSIPCAPEKPLVTQTKPLPPPKSFNPQQTCAQPIHAIIDQLSPIIYQEPIFPLLPPSGNPDGYYRTGAQPMQIQLQAQVVLPSNTDYITESLFPPHPGVRPPAARKTSISTIGSHTSKRSVGSRMMSVASLARILPVSISVPMRRSSLKFSRRKLGR